MSDVHDNIRPLIAAYAIGAVPEEEIPPIRAHILSCEDCFAEAESFARASAVLAELVEPIALPADFEQRVLKEVRTEKTLESPARQSWLKRWRTPLLAGATAVFTGIILLVSLSYLTSDTSPSQYRETVTALVQDPDALNLEGPGGARATLASTSEGSVLVAVDLGEAPSGRDYQLWLMKKGRPTPADTFDVSESVVIIESPRSLEGYDGAAVTVEPEGGSKAPTTEPVLST